MERAKWILLISGIIFNLCLHAQGFKHPGALHTQEDFDRIKTQLADGNEMVVAAYENLKANEWSQSNIGTWPVETIKRGIAGDENYINAARGAHAAYMNALRWKISGDVAHADRAVQILNTWASTTTGIRGNSNLSLASGLYGYEFANAAEIMRDYEGWSAADFKAYQEWMMYVWYPYIVDFLERRHDTWSQGRPGHYWSNWGLCNTLALVSIGVLCDDAFVYNQGLSYYKYDIVGTFKEDKTGDDHLVNDGLTEFIGNLVPIVWEDERGPYGQLGQMQESGRDQGHTLMALGLATDICQIAWNQGDDLFGYMENRLAAGIEFVAAYNTGTDDLPWKDYWYHDVRTAIHNSWVQTANNEGGRGQYRPYWDRIIGHYEGIKGISMPFSIVMRDNIGADFGGGGSTSGGYDHLGFSTLTCTREAVTAEQAPTTISTQITYDGTTYDKGELSNIVAGSYVTLIPVLPEGETNTGNWSWESGETSQELEITANESKLYRVTYINSNGVSSTQTFSIAVNGDCWPDRYTYSINYDGSSYNDTVITVKQNAIVQLSVWSSSWRSSFQWDNGATDGTITINLANTDSTCYVIGTNRGGAQHKIGFHIQVDTLGYAYSIDEGTTVYKSNIALTSEQSVTLTPQVKKGVEGGTWLWSDGSTEPTLTISNPEEASEINVTYTYDGMEYSLTYSLYILSSIDNFAYWPMDENIGSTALDIWQGNTLELNEASWVRYAARNSGIGLDGSTDSFASLPADITSSLDDFTIALWVYPSTIETWSRIWDFGNGTDNYLFLTGLASDGYARFAIKNGGSEQTITTTHTLVSEEWTHFAVSKTGNQCTLYINGEVAGSNSSVTISPSDLGYTGQNYLGKSQYADPLFQGTLDELYIYSRGFSQEEIVELQNNIIPDAPANLQAVLVDGDVELSWDAVPGARSYNVKRSTTQGGEYETLRSTIRTSYTNRSVADGTYYYVVSAISGPYEGENAVEATVNVTSSSINKVNSNSIKIQPNPVNDICAITFTDTPEASQINIYNISGSLINCPVNYNNGRISIEMGQLISGVYLIEFVGQDYKLTKRIIKK